jgi:hypothetical protein
MPVQREGGVSRDVLEFPGLARAQADLRLRHLPYARCLPAVRDSLAGSGKTPHLTASSSPLRARRTEIDGIRALDPG